jgi:CDP-ribitol ribitolphosphotransferase
MAHLKYRTFAWFFNFYNQFISSKSDQLSFIGWKEDNLGGNLGYVFAELEKRGHYNYNFIFKDEYSFSNVNSLSSSIKKILDLINLFLFKSYHLAASSHIFLSDNFLPMAYLNLGPETTVVQLWHAAGAFKKFGLSSVTDNELRELERKISEKLDYIVVSSDKVAPFYEEAFGVPKKKVLGLGIPRTDFYFENNNGDYIKNLKERFEAANSQIKNKKIVLYAPTFRDQPSMDKKIINNFNVKLFNEELKDEYCLMVRLHPQINQGVLEEHLQSGELINVTDYPDEKELLLLADILITDYSSIMIEYALLNKPIIFYPYDYQYYIKEERGFYVDYMADVPGPVAFTPQEVIGIIKKDSYDFQKIKNFVKSQFDYLDGKSTKRLINYIMNNK